MTRIAVVEDDANEREQICAFLQKYAAETAAEVQLHAFISGEEFLISPWQNHFDLLLLDIQMEPTDGMAVAQEVRRTDRDVIIVFITQLASYAVQGYSVHAYDFMVKPITYEFFARKMEGILSACRKQVSETVSFRTVQGGLLQLRPEDILYVELAGRKLFLHTQDGTHQCYLTMQEAENRLNPDIFFRCHSSFLVNLRYVRRIDKDTCRLDTQDIPVSRHRRRDFLEAMNLYMSNRI